MASTTCPFEMAGYFEQSTNDCKKLMGIKLHDHAQPYAYHCETPLGVMEHQNDPRNVRQTDVSPEIEAKLSLSLVRLIGDGFSPRKHCRRNMPSHSDSVLH